MNASSSPMQPGDSRLLELVAHLGQSWPNIERGIERTRETRARIAHELDREIQVDTTFVAFGSLARDEFCEDSDLDWTLLIDGQVDEAHLTAAHGIDQMLSSLELKGPGPTEVFGNLAFSHELVHVIGGTADSNVNTTRRMLLLLESVTVGAGVEVRERVITQLLKRYIEDDHGYRTARRPHVPHFLLNDIVRFWRTMAVDFAAKRRDRQGKGWALRRFKLRMSRKLIFSAGLAACLGCQLWPGDDLERANSSDEEFCDAMAARIRESLMLTPLEALASVGQKIKADEALGQVLNAYDEFMGFMADKDRRSALEGMLPDEDPENDLLVETGRIADAFQLGLTKLFFESDEALADATRRYGVF